ncbi:hypothetical protein M011DRAFT_394178 [Sporormia fimetaria CBS 119925]|uniref:Swiss Army Knife RNA repair protein HAD domain-containing protein n=1 Tax=Sporormia fimetaria CBS 119925 TaxID=1340428 RepID=A0A6A6VNH6_9PLEO|nr:hypothetical protein M011DRAFT_394178 [Sporormia fimetaria CBS 119925]
MTSAYSAVSTKSVQNPSPHTPTSLSRWRCNDEDEPLPKVDEIKAIHVYDFDNTLFASPLPNKTIWNQMSIGQLSSPDAFTHGGWWHDSSILAATGEGLEKEEARAWAGWWNEQIVSLVELTMQQKDALCVLLTGRSEKGFADLIKRMVRSKGLKFDMVCLKPAIGPAGQRFKSTMEFKQELLKEIVYTYKDAGEIRIYEDRVKHTKGFRDFFFDFNSAAMRSQLNPPRAPLIAEVIQVPENATSLDPVTEIAEIQRMINLHNKAILSGTASSNATPYTIKKTVFYTGYMIPSSVTEKLISLVRVPQNVPKGDIKYLANSILITPRPAPRTILERVGGLGAKCTWRVTGTALFENKLWAARVEPVPKNAKIYSENNTPTVVLATRKGARPADAVRIQNWHPVAEDMAFEFETTVAEKSALVIREERREGEDWEPGQRGAAGKRTRDENSQGRDTGANKENRSGYAGRGGHHRGRGRGGGGYRGDRGGGYGNQRGRGSGGGGGGYGTRDGGNYNNRGGSGHAPRGRGRGGGQPAYRSLDDMGDQRGVVRPDYDDGPGSYY